MPRPKKARTIRSAPGASYYKPQGIQMSALKEVCLNIDEVEAIRLADREGMTQAEGAELMHISRATFGRILEKAHRKIADAILGGKALRIENVDWALGIPVDKTCGHCGRHFQASVLEREQTCPDCD